MEGGGELIAIMNIINLKLATSTENATSTSIITPVLLVCTLVVRGFGEEWVANPFSRSRTGGLGGHAKLWIKYRKRWVRLQTPNLPTYVRLRNASLLRDQLPARNGKMPIS